jgi:uncharacterized protein (DUF342 family)
MMKKLAAFVVLAMACGAGVGQTSAVGQANQTGQAGQTDSQVLQAILVEMRALHNDVRLSQTTQILLTEMEVQRGVVDKALQKRDDAQNRLTQWQTNAKNLAAQLAQLEENASATSDPVQKKRITDQEENLKASIANMKNLEQAVENALPDAESALRKEQDTLSGIQDQLDAVVRKLQPVQ